MREEQLDRAQLANVRREREGRRPLLVRNDRVGGGVEQQPRAINLSALARPVQGGGAELGCVLDVSARGDELLRAACAPVLAC